MGSVEIREPGERPHAKPFYRCWAEIDLDALQGNFDVICGELPPGACVIAVVKADAYGHGLGRVVDRLVTAKVAVLGVAGVAEGVSVRARAPERPVLILGSCLPEEVPDCIEHGLMPTISTMDEARFLAQAASARGKRLSVHVKVDTGMGRLGASPVGAVDLAAWIAESKSLSLAGVYTHFAAAEEDAPFTRGQAQAFQETLERLDQQGVAIPLRHAHNSAGFLHEPLDGMNGVRPGLILYGVLPNGRRALPAFAHRLRPVLSWKCRVTLVKKIPQGKPLSYGHTFRAPKPMRVATVTVGYGDGFARSASNRAAVLIRGARCPVLGRVTMDQVIVDVTHVPDACYGDEAVILGYQGQAQIRAEDLAAWCGTIPWEILTNISYRVPRVSMGSRTKGSGKR